MFVNEIGSFQHTHRRDRYHHERLHDLECKTSIKCNTLRFPYDIGKIANDPGLKGSDCESTEEEAVNFMIFWISQRHMFYYNVDQYKRGFERTSFYM